MGKERLGGAVLITLKDIVKRTCGVVKVYLIYVQVVVCEDLTLVNVLVLVYVQVIQVEVELFIVFTLNLFHLSVIPK